MVAYRFRGYGYHVTLGVGEDKLKEVMTIEVEDDATADQWKGTFSAEYIQDLTQKTGNYKQFDIFVNMMESALTKSTDSVTLDLLTYGDLQLLRNQKSTCQAQSSSEALNSKRYLILTYSVEFDRIHYPLPLPYLGKPNPVALLRTIRELRTENEDLRKRLDGENTVADQSIRLEFEKQLEDAITQNSQLERANEELTNELSVFREGRASKELRMLKGVVASMEEDLLKEKNRHQRSAAKSQQEIRRLKDQVEQLSNAESDLKIRVRNLTTELSTLKRPGAQFRSRASPSPQRSTADTRPSRSLSRSSSAHQQQQLFQQQQKRPSSHGRTPVKSSSSISYRSASSSGARERSLSAGDRRSTSGRRSAFGGLVSEKLNDRRRSASGDRRGGGVGGAATSKERLPASSATRFSGGVVNYNNNNNSSRDNKLGSKTNCQSEARIRYRSPSPSNQSSSVSKRFDPTDYVRQKKEKEKERQRRNSVEKRYKLGGRGRGGASTSSVGTRRSDSRGEATPSHPPARGLMSASPEDMGSRKGRTSSGGSVSRSSSVESLNSQKSFGGGTQTKKNPLRLSNEMTSRNSNGSGNNNNNNNYNSSRPKAASGCKPSSAGKENHLAESSAPDSSLNVNDNDVTQETDADVTNDVSLPVDPDNEMAEIDARLNALQNFMKSMGHS